MWGHAAVVQTGELVFWRLDETYGCPARYTAGDGLGRPLLGGASRSGSSGPLSGRMIRLRGQLVLSSHTRVGGNLVRVTASGRVAELTGMVYLLPLVHDARSRGPSRVI